MPDDDARARLVEHLVHGHRVDPRRVPLTGSLERFHDDLHADDPAGTIPDLVGRVARAWGGLVTLLRQLAGADPETAGQLARRYAEDLEEFRA